MIRALVLTAAFGLLAAASAQAHRTIPCGYGAGRVNALALTRTYAKQRLGGWSVDRWHNAEVLTTGPGCTRTRHGYYVHFNGRRQDILDNNRWHGCAGFVHIIHATPVRAYFHCFTE